MFVIINGFYESLVHVFEQQAAASALEAKVALLDANHIEHVDARLQVG